MSVGPSYDWCDYDQWPLDDLLALKESLDASLDEQWCDNFAPGTCCHECNYSLIKSEVAKRLAG